MSLNSNSSDRTLRLVSPSLEEILEKEIPVLDNGFIRVIDYMGNDCSIVQAARVSYGAGTKHQNTDKALIDYLMRHDHTTPFEMCEIKFHVKLPIFVARQWMRHRTGSFNEYSARYSVLQDEYYLPNKNHITQQSDTNKQARDMSKTINDEKADQFIELSKEKISECYKLYLEMMENGVAREIARTVLPVTYYTQFYWKVNLHNLLHFTRLRAHQSAQFEIRQYAEKIIEIIEKWVPFAYEAFLEHKQNSKRLSNKNTKFIQKVFNKEYDIKEKFYEYVKESELSQRDKLELQQFLDQK